MNAIFSGVDGKNFKMISTCEIAKKAWDILQTAHEGTTKVKISRMETVTSKFKSLRMQGDETIADFNTWVLDISNKAFALGEPMTEESLVRKVLRSLTKRFSMKALAVKEANDVKTMRLDELMGSLQTHEMDMNDEDRLMKNKSIGLKAEASHVPDKMGDLSEQQYAMLAKNFGKFMRKQYNKGTDSSQSYNSRFQKDGKFQKGNQSGDSNHDNKGKGIQCRDCEGYGHIRAECINTQKKKKKKNAYAISWSDKDLSGREEKKASPEDHILYSSCSDNEEITDEEIANNYKELYQEWLVEVKWNKQLQNSVGNLEEKLRTEDAEKLEHLQTITDLKAQLIEAKNDRVELMIQKAELLAVVSSLKIQNERERGDHPELWDDLKRENNTLK
ncbi:unnamed protein product [Rhodiola kirilowii]